MSGPVELTLDEAMDRIGMGRFQAKLLAVAGASWAADAMEVLLLGFAIPSLIAGWGISREAASYLGTALFVGMMVGAWGWGTIADRIGRKLGFVVTILIDSVFGLLSAIAPNYWTLMIFRFFTGFGVGGTLPVDYSITAEFLPRQHRGRWLVYLESFWALGTIAAALLAWLIIPRFPELGWRFMFAASAVPGLVVFWVRRNIPESPRFLLTHGREAEARAVLQQVAGENGVTLPADFRLKLDVAARAAQVEAQPLTTIFKMPFLRSTLMLSAVWFFLSLGYYGIFTWLPTIFAQQGFTFVRSYENTLILALAQIPGYFSAAWLIEKWGRRKTLAAYLVAGGIFTLAFALVTNLPGIVIAASMMSFFSLGAWGCVYAYTPELYPTTIRVTGMGWASAMARLAGIFAPPLGAQLLGLSLPLALSVYAGCFVLAGATALFGQETMGRRLADTVTDASSMPSASSPSAAPR